ncbi:hypothetical protein [Pseudomonas serbica]|uniref:hypothetical protein n=1 Tax=Pseudomonas serbica TaxID=2965074 RepID=UPI00237ABBD9|nr:hypothetical protein [Pseudomonas serbica]
MLTDLTAKQKREVVTEQARALGYTIDRIDLRSCLALMRNDVKIVRVSFCRVSTGQELRDAVVTAHKHGFSWGVAMLRQVNNSAEG